MNKEALEIDLHKNVDFAEVIQKKILSDKWQTALIEEENQVINILYNSGTALNLQEIRRHLVSSTIYHIIKKLKELQSIEKKELKKILGSKSPYFTSKKHSEMNEKILKELSLDNYKGWAYLSFTKSQAANFFFEINKLIRNYQIHKKFKPTKKEMSTWLKNADPEKPYDHYADTHFVVESIISNKSRAEELFSILLRKLNMEIYGFKKMKDILINLNALNIVLTRRPLSERVKVVYFLNPFISEHLENREKTNN